MGAILHIVRNPHKDATDETSTGLATSKRVRLAHGVKEAISARASPTHGSQPHKDATRTSQICPQPKEGESSARLSTRKTVQPAPGVLVPVCVANTRTPPAQGRNQHRDATSTRTPPTQGRNQHKDATNTRTQPTQGCNQHKDATSTRTQPTQGRNQHKDATNTWFEDIGMQLAQRHKHTQWPFP